MVAESLIVGLLGWFTGPTISTGLGKIRSIWEDHQELQGSAQNILDNLALEVDLARLLLEANQTKEGNTDLKPRLDEMKGYVSEAEILLDEFEAKKVLKNIKVSDKLAIDDNYIKKLKAVLEKLVSRRKGLHDFLGTPKSHNNEEGMIGSSHCSPPASKPVYGRDTEIQQLLDLVIHNKSNCPPKSTEPGVRACANHPRLIVIQGTAGVGKTTLAQVIYNHPIKEAFDMRGWVFVNKCAIGSICKNIIHSLKAEEQPFDSGMSLASLHNRSDSSEGNLTSIIENKRFFIVLDDVQDNFHTIWADLSPIFTNGTKGSIVLATTRSDDVAERMGGIIQKDCCVLLNPLPPSTLWTILKYHALDSKKREHPTHKEQDSKEREYPTPEEQKELESIGQTIAGKLNGLPLLAELIGCLLSKKLNEKHWRKVSGSTWWNLNEDDDNPVLPSAMIVCDCLTIPMKNCLCYCSIFPSAYLFEKKRLMHMWTANFAHQASVETMKESFFNELLSMSFLQPVHSENMYIMHDLLRESTSFVNWDDLHQIQSIDISRPQLDGNELRTMILTDGYKTTNRNEKLAEILSRPSKKYLWVLDLSNIKMELTSHPSGDLKQLISPPDAIHTFEYLRYLDLSHTKITEIPESFCELRLLQVLGLRGCHFKSLPRRMTELINLRYLYAEGYTLSLIYKIGQLTKLLELEEFHVSETNQIVELRNMNQLSGQLCIANLEKVSLTVDAAEAELCRKTHLNKLVLKWNDPIPSDSANCMSNPISSDSDDGMSNPISSNSDDCMPNPISPEKCMSILEVLEPPRDLKELKIQGYRGFIFPKWAGMGQDFKYLQRIHISRCKQLQCLPPLGLLPALKFLILSSLPSVEKIGNDFYGDKKTVFKSLMELIFHSMVNWKIWSGKETWQSIPQLKKIRIENCPRLEEAPLHNFRETLSELVISGCGSILDSGRCVEGLGKLEHLKICKYPGSIAFSCSSLTSLVVLNVSNDGSKIDLSGTEQIPNLTLLVINGDVQVIPDKLKLAMQDNKSSD